MAVVSERVSRIVPESTVRVWAVISDTEVLNRAAGLAPMSLAPFESPDSPARQAGRTSYGGFPATFEEYPYEFERERFTQVRRRVTTGVMKEVLARVEMEGVEGGGTRITAIFSAELRFPFLGIIARVNLRKATALFVDAVARLASGEDASPRTPVDAEALRFAADRLALSSDAPCASALVDWVAHADDVTVQRIRPYVLADRLGLPRRDMLATCVAASEAGLVALQWQLVCPSCRNGAAVLDNLADIEADKERCHACEATFDLDMDRSVEAVFAPAPRVRPVPEVQYCSGGPARTPHVFAQANAAAGAVVTLGMPTRPGVYRLWARGGAHARVEVLPPDEAPAEAEVDPSAEEVVTVRVAAGGVLRARNPHTHAAHVKLETLDVLDDAATALDVTTLGAFRRQYGRHALRPGISLKIGRVAFLFSDLSDSTRLYADLGDAEAFRVVHDHFTLLQDAIVQGGGTLVKTIGVAVMAAFPAEDAAIRTALACLAAFEPFRASDPSRGRTDLKVGVHVGPCYAVTANNLLDYFGQTVNVAARLQGLAASGELVITEALADSARACGGEVIRVEEVVLKGVLEPVRVARVRLRPTGA
jgi:class 3 adenylate cyclase